MYAVDSLTSPPIYVHDRASHLRLQVGSYVSMDQSADLYTYIHINVYVCMFRHHCGTCMHTPVQVCMSAVECIHTQLCRCVVS